MAFKESEQVSLKLDENQEKVNKAAFICFQFNKYSIYIISVDTPLFS